MATTTENYSVAALAREVAQRHQTSTDAARTLIEQLLTDDGLLTPVTLTEDGTFTPDMAAHIHGWAELLRRYDAPLFGPADLAETLINTGDASAHRPSHAGWRILTLSDGSELAFVVNAPARQLRISEGSDHPNHYGNDVEFHRITADDYDLAVSLLQTVIDRRERAHHPGAAAPLT